MHTFYQTFTLQIPLKALDQPNSHRLELREELLWVTLCIW